MEQETLNTEEIKKFYDEHDEMWEINNWYKYTEHEIISYIQNQAWNEENYILNAGSGGHNYGVNLPMLHVDISEKKLQGLPNSILASLENVDLSSYTFSSVICVGSVINYCNIYNLIQNFGKWLSKDGLLILEFENSSSLEYIFSKHFNKSISVVKTNYIEKEHKINVYSLNLVLNLLKNNNFKIIEVFPFHILSSLALRLGFSESVASKFSKFDNILRKIPYLKKHPANFIVKCKKC